jgi:hypothetical protein
VAQRFILACSIDRHGAATAQRRRGDRTAVSNRFT